MESIVHRWQFLLQKNQQHKTHCGLTNVEKVIAVSVFSYLPCQKLLV